MRVLVYLYLVANLIQSYFHNFHKGGIIMWGMFTMVHLFPDRMSVSLIKISPLSNAWFGHHHHDNRPVYNELFIIRTFITLLHVAPDADPILLLKLYG